MSSVRTKIDNTVCTNVVEESIRFSCKDEFNIYVVLYEQLGFVQ